MTTADPPYVDAHHTTIEASSQVVWRTLRAYVDRMLAAADDSWFTRLLGTQPSAGFAIADEEPERQLVLAGRHRFSRYRLVFELEPTDGGTILRALTYAAFPGLHGRVYRLLVISSRAHVLATRRMLTAIRRACRT